MKMLSQLAVLATLGCLGMHSAAAETPDSHPSSIAAARSNVTTPPSNAAKARAMPNGNAAAGVKLGAMPNNAANAGGAKQAALSNVAASARNTAMQKPPSNAPSKRPPEPR